MSPEAKTKINRLISQWPRGTVGVASYLNASGFSYDLLTRYKKSGWIQSFGRGAYILFGDKVEWPGALYALQVQLGLSVHAGGKTSLEMKGYAHYLSSGQRRVFLYGPPGQVLEVHHLAEQAGHVDRTGRFRGYLITGLSAAGQQQNGG